MPDKKTSTTQDGLPTLDNAWYRRSSTQPAQAAMSVLRDWSLLALCIIVRIVETRATVDVLNESLHVGSEAHGWWECAQEDGEQLPPTNGRSPDDV